MYNKTEIFLIIACIVIAVLGLIGYFKEEKYKKDTEGKNKIIKYFKDNKATDIEHAIDIRQIPKEFIKSSYIFKMNKEKILNMENGKFYLNKK